MSVQLYPIVEKDNFDSSWFSWRPIWHYAANHNPELKAIENAGHYNDPAIIPTEALGEALKGVTGKDIVNFCRTEPGRLGDYHLFPPKDYDEMLTELRAFCAKYPLGCMIS